MNPPEVVVADDVRVEYYFGLPGAGKTWRARL